jgi:hypothetical protein
LKMLCEKETAPVRRDRKIRPPKLLRSLFTVGRDSRILANNE